MHSGTEQLHAKVILSFLCLMISVLSLNSIEALSYTYMQFIEIVVYIAINVILYLYPTYVALFLVLDNLLDNFLNNFILFNTHWLSLHFYFPLSCFVILTCVFEYFLRIALCIFLFYFSFIFKYKYDLLSTIRFKESLPQIE